MTYKNPVCKGDWMVGTACGTCERCVESMPKAIAQLRQHWRDAREETRRVRHILDNISKERQRWYDEAEHLEETLASLVEASRPFVEAADCLGEGTRGNSEIWEMPAAMSITAGDLRKVKELHLSLKRDFIARKLRTKERLRQERQSCDPHRGT